MSNAEFMRWVALAFSDQLRSQQEQMKGGRRATR